MTEWQTYEAAVRDEIGVPAGDDERVRRAIDAAIDYVNGAIGGYSVPETVKTDCVTACAADLYNARDARLGVMNVADSTLEPYRISTDPLRSVWPKLNAVGVPTGGMVIA
ncbi:hypothetical protein BISA_1926 [Bifidobacterium saguini DSM 23967]|uniref:Head-to-tail adaptor n=2 Tax=Bifidobacterium saguini TaxID=762210 RepID=A0A087D5Z7_9BIFI|nr:phage gp6-like head-tail connector protein [Bifidobacterium saguini]KFI90947.1 hypothetical protein BISA_1926 [Bifidobacterium saguini DSM 23967]QTB91439.1 phage gp6-like head-tail connector protein [Bifidobacterium saguini]